MTEWITLLAFVPAALALNLTPGADMMFCLGQGLRSGPKAAVAASAGISLGAFIHTGLAGLGLGAVVATVPGAFEVIRWAGVAYLLFLAVQLLRGDDAKRSKVGGMSVVRAFRTGLVVNLTNPKVILFVVAFLPQFVRPEGPPVLVQFLILGAVMALGGFVINGAVGIFASGLGARLARGSRILDYVTGGIFAALALRLALLERSA
ncbi:LysE family translocator [Pseudosulfitobacter koreensis]|uniref:LysE family translocator n=1 Tax=Pseudosulfitobacter koreensis TaxID=2968472 RepID=A0ABT1YYW7_9RHOB|nr:LysE family translocator [Pseudosulfitobacter koreense]MCR8826080.1 LysE family translocator [Pseudosulfitobacter koreense]